MNRVLSRLGLTAVAIVAGSALYAQSSTTGAISGVVTDNSGAPLAGASVTLTSAQVTRTIITGADGSFRLGLLNPGTWQVRVAKDTFQTANSTVTVSTNDTRALSFKLPLAAETTVTITSSVAVVDPTSNTQGLNVSMSQLAAIPKAGRDFSAVAYFAPGVVDSGGFDSKSPSMGGASAAENSYVVDGLDTKDYRSGFQSSALKTDFIDQVDVQTGGFRPEYSALGGVIVAITKSGTNEFKGSAWTTWDAVGLQAVPKKSAYAIQGPPNTRYDVGAEVGGAFIKDKLFYYFGVDDELIQGATPLANNDPNLIGTKPKTSFLQFVGKLNWYLTQDMQLTLFGNYNNQKADQDVAYPLYGTANLGNHATQDAINFNASYDWTINSNLQLSAKLGYTDNKTKNSPSDSTNQAVSDSSYYLAGGPGGTGGSRYNPSAGLAGTPYAFRTGGTFLYQPLYEGKTTQAKMDLSWFVGSHTLKFGVSSLSSQYTLNQQPGGPANPKSGNGTYALLYSVDSSRRLNTYEEHTNATVKTLYNGLYAQDTWEVIPGFRLMYGLRYEEQNLKGSDGSTFAKFSGSDYVQPRLGFTWDLNNDGKTTVSGSYATYFEDIPQQVSIRVFANETYLRHRYTTANYTYAYDPTGLKPNFTITGPYSLTIDYATPFSYDPIANGTKLPQRQEYTLGVDHTLDSGWTVGVHGTYRKLKNVIEDSVLTNKFGSYYDSGLAYAFSGSGAPLAWAGQAILWNPGPGGVTWTARTSPNSLNSGQFINVNPSQNLFADKAGNQYEALNFVLSKRTDRDFVNFNYTWSRLQGNYEGLVSSSNGQADSNITASFDYFPYVGSGILPLDRTHVVKLEYSHTFTVASNDLNLGFAWTYQSGTPLSLFDDGSYTNGDPAGWDTNHNYGGLGVITSSNYSNSANWTGGIIPTNASNTGYLGTYNTWYDIGGYGNAVPANGQLGQFGRSPALNNVDMHLDYVVKLRGKLRVIPSMDVFNLFNARNVTGVTQQATTGNGSPNPLFGNETGWQVGRRYRFGVKVQF